MNRPPDLKNCQIGIVGLGLMGASFALALRGKCQSIFGVDLDEKTLTHALTNGIVDQGALRMNKSLKNIDILILAVPVNAILSIIPTLPGFISKKTLIIDIGSTKRQIMEAFNTLLEPYESVGGHPMCGKALGGIIHAEAGLFKDASFFLVKSRTTSELGANQIEHIVNLIGAKAHWIDAATHDHMTAGTSHLPYLLSCALVQSTPISFSKFIGPGYKSTSRLASTPLSMMGDIMETNQDEIIKQLDCFLSELSTYRDLLAQNKLGTLKDLLSKVSDKQKMILKENGGLLANEN